MDKKNNLEATDDFDEVDIGSVEDQKKKIKNIFFDACKSGDTATVKKFINHKLLNILEPDANKWTALQWAVENNKKEVVKIVYKRQKELEDTEKQKNPPPKEEVMNKFDPAFKKPQNPAENGKYTPLHWSAYKGFDAISSVLLKLGCDPLSLDMYGNNAFHQACAGNHISSCKLFLGLGNEICYKNSRNHMAIDLTTNEEIIKLIESILEKKRCYLCNKLFDFYNRRFLCCIKDDHVICKECTVCDYYYESAKAPEKDMRDCRCRKCYEEIVNTENDLKKAIDSNNLDTLKAQYEISKDYKICLHLRELALKTLDKLSREKMITQLLDSVKVVKDYKIILKTIEELMGMLECAEKNGVTLDSKIIERAFFDKNRLEAERDLRQSLEHITIDLSTQGILDNLKEKIENAKKCNVDKRYIEKGESLAEKMRQNIVAKEIMDLFIEYPIREYPVIEVVDPKSKNKAKPKSPPKKKKKKKEPPFLVPDWAKDIDVVASKVEELKICVNNSSENGLPEDFCSKAKEQLARFDKEIPFRREEEERLRKLEEEKAKKKKNKVKK